MAVTKTCTKLVFTQRFIVVAPGVENGSRWGGGGGGVKVIDSYLLVGLCDDMLLLPPVVRLGQVLL